MATLKRKRQPSKVWQYFTRGKLAEDKSVILNDDDGPGATCNMCGAFVKGLSPTNLLNHLERATNNRKLTEEDRKRHGEAAAACRESISVKKRKLEELYLSGEYPEKKTPKKETNEDSGRQSILRKKQPDRALALYVLLGMFPVSSIEQNDGLRALIALSIEGKYTFPTSSTIRKELDDLAEKTSGAIQQILTAPKTISLSVESWVDKYGRGYSSIVAHFSKNREPQNLVVTLVPHEGKDEEDILEIIRETIEQWDLKKKVIAVISDTGKITFNDVLARSPSVFCDEDVDPLTWKETIGLNTVFAEAVSLTCYAQELQDALNAVTKQTHVASTLKEFRELATKFKKSPAAIEHVQDSDAFKEDVQHVTPGVLFKWNRPYDFLRRMAVLKDAIQKAGKAVGIETLAPAKWEKLAAVVELLQPIASGIAALTGLDPLNPFHTSISSVIPTISKVKKSYEKDLSNYESSTYKDLFKFIREDLDKRFQAFEPLLLAATLLDPRFRHRKMSNEDIESAKEVLKHLYDSYKLAPQTEETPAENAAGGKGEGQEASDSDSDEEQDTAKLDLVPLWSVELSRYLSNKRINKGSDPLTWWREQASSYPSLVALAECLLTVPATSVPTPQNTVNSAALIARYDSLVSDKIFDLAIRFKLNSKLLLDKVLPRKEADVLRGVGVLH